MLGGIYTFLTLHSVEMLEPREMDGSTSSCSENTSYAIMKSPMARTEVSCNNVLSNASTTVLIENGNKTNSGTIALGGEPPIRNNLCSHLFQLVRWKTER